MILLSIFSRDNKGQDEINPPVNRKAFAAGKFFAGDKSGLEADLKELFTAAKTKEYDDVSAIVVPHAGYSYSGIVAASGYNQLDPDREYDHIFVIASSHTAHYSGASIYNRGNYETPLGEVEVDRDLATQLINENDVFSFQAKAHISEHSLEVQLPFLQYHLQKAFKIIPIVIGSQDTDACEEIAAILTPYFNEKNLFVISTDFSHFPSYEDANIVDKKTADAVTYNSKKEFLKVLKENEGEGIPNLATSMCGWSSVLTLLNLTADKPEYQFHQIQYMNSGDAGYDPDKSRVVGYYAIVLTADKPNGEDRGFVLSDEDKTQLLEVARLSMQAYVMNGGKPKLDTRDYSENIKTPCGAFVTLYKDGNLRGCIGRFDAKEPLFEVVQEMAVSSATKDYRFPKVNQDEFGEIEIEISVLTPMKKISSIDEIELGKHGIYIVQGTRSGTFLPQVATETAWKLEQFLGHCAQDKAGIGWDGWKNADIYTYEALVFHEYS